MVRAARISLVVGVPLDLDEFIVRSGSSDFLKRWCALGQRLDIADAESVWASSYRECADALQSLVKRAGDLGVRVQAGATLTDVHTSSLDSDVLIVLGHWKGADLATDDFLSFESEDFLARLEGDMSELATWIRGELSRPPSVSERVLEVFGLRRVTRSIQYVLTRALDQPVCDHGVFDGLVDEIIEHPEVRRARRRDWMDEKFAGLLQAGNRLELFDGLHDAHTVELSIAQHFHGVLDMTTCTSTRFADYVAGRRGQDVLTVQFTGAVDAAWAALCLTSALALHVQAGLNYQAARVAAIRLVAAAVADGVRGEAE